MSSVRESGGRPHIESMRARHKKSIIHEGRDLEARNCILGHRGGWPVLSLSPLHLRLWALLMAVLEQPLRTRRCIPWFDSSIPLAGESFEGYES